MLQYVQNIIRSFPDKDKINPAETPSSTYIFQLMDDSQQLDTIMGNKFHHFVSQLLYLTKKVRPDIATAVAFLSTRVMYPTCDYWKKLLRCIRYLTSTRLLKLNLEADISPVSNCWVDASYGVHKDLRSHSGGAFTLDKGSISSYSTKQKLNTKSSTEAELVAVDDIYPHIIWTNNFLLGQGYNTDGQIIYQDNNSALLLENNGTFSRGK